MEINSSKVVDMIETKISKNRIAKTMFYQGLGLFMSILGSVFKNMGGRLECIFRERTTANVYRQ